MSEKIIFHEFHPDAEDLFNVTCDLKLVCEKLSDRTQRHKRQVPSLCLVSPKIMVIDIYILLTDKMYPLIGYRSWKSCQASTGPEGV